MNQTAPTQPTKISRLRAYGAGKKIPFFGSSGFFSMSLWTVDLRNGDASTRFVVSDTSLYRKGSPGTPRLWPEHSLFLVRGPVISDDGEVLEPAQPGYDEARGGFLQALKVPALTVAGSKPFHNPEALLDLVANKVVNVGVLNLATNDRGDFCEGNLVFGDDGQVVTVRLFEGSERDDGKANNFGYLSFALPDHLIPSGLTTRRTPTPNTNPDKPAGYTTPDGTEEEIPF